MFCSDGVVVKGMPCFAYSVDHPTHLLRGEQVEGDLRVIDLDRRLRAKSMTQCGTCSAVPRITGVIVLIISHRVKINLELSGDQLKLLEINCMHKHFCHCAAISAVLSNRVQQMVFQGSPNAMQAQ